MACQAERRIAACEHVIGHVVLVPATTRARDNGAVLNSTPRQCGVVKDELVRRRHDEGRNLSVPNLPVVIRKGSDCRGCAAVVNFRSSLFAMDRGRMHACSAPSLLIGDWLHEIAGHPQSSSDGLLLPSLADSSIRGGAVSAISLSLSR